MSRFVLICLIVASAAALSSCGGGTPQGDVPPGPPQSSPVSGAPQAESTRKVVYLVGPFANFSATRQGDTVSIKDNVGLEGNLTRTAPLTVRFSDVDVVFDSAGTEARIYRLYQAAFDRKPDLGGLGFQINAVEAGLAMLDLSNNFMNSPEFRTRYGDVSDTQFVNLLYRNVLKREPDAGGLAFHIDNLQTGAVGRQQLLINFADSPENQRNVSTAVDSGIVYQPHGARQRYLVGVAATGGPIGKALAVARSIKGEFGRVVTDETDGSYVIPLPTERLGPVKLTISWTENGEKKELISIENDSPVLPFDSFRMNTTGLTDAIARSIAELSSSFSGTIANWIPSSADTDKVETTQRNLKTVLGPLMPGSVQDFGRQRFEADPRIDDMDRLLERARIAESKLAIAVKDANQNQIASITKQELTGSASPGGDTQVVTQAEATQAITAAGPLDTPPQPILNQVQPALLPAPEDVKATYLGGLKFRLEWKRVEGASRYYIYYQRGSALNVSAGHYRDSDNVPTMALSGGGDLAVQSVEYTVDAPGTYYFVVAAVKDALPPNQFTEHDLGEPAAAVSLSIDPNAPAALPGMWEIRAGGIVLGTVSGADVPTGKDGVTGAVYREVLRKAIENHHKGMFQFSSVSVSGGPETYTSQFTYKPGYQSSSSKTSTTDKFQGVVAYYGCGACGVNSSVSYEIDMLLESYSSFSPSNIRFAIYYQRKS